MSKERIEEGKLNELLELHRKWDAGEEGGKRLELPGANLRGANLWVAHLGGAGLMEADLREANLGEADLRGADLREADLRGASLKGASLREANLRGANLEGAKDANLYECNWGELSDELTLEGMRKDAASHHDPEAFSEWAKGKEYPYGNSLLPRRFLFKEKKELWRKGKPKLSDWEFLKQILEEKKVKF